MKKFEFVYLVSCNNVLVHKDLSRVKIVKDLDSAKRKAFCVGGVVAEVYKSPVTGGKNELIGFAII